ncbi:MAG: hypothetical protein ACREOH_16085 [Candidatus Entotheonellia bacterium]
MQAILALVNDLFFLLKIRDTVTHVGYSMHVAGSVGEFFDKLARTCPSLIILDLTISGVEIPPLLRQLREDPHQRAIPVLAYTTHADWKRTAPLHAECSRVVTKDTLSHQMPELIQQLIHQD